MSSRYYIVKKRNSFGTNQTKDYYVIFYRNHFSAENIYNVDECEMTTVQSHKAIISEAGQSKLVP